ncbi:hypothetical protein [Usitatibacter rugosus]|uniref:hypothetical protein n=1 Tax=Usitatibacter rugosus TaxID=2732067 RepID=UPI001BB1A735|nr:hypothetical protein [Usitatibacter rugosus]
MKPHRTFEAVAVALLAGALALPAGAQTLGDLELRSAPGEPLDATVALGSANGAPVTAECLFLSRGAAEDGPFITRAQVAVFDEGGERYARFRSDQPVQDRNARLRIVVRCPGQPHVAYREYRDLFEPRVASAPSPVAAPVATAAPIGDTTGLQVRNGDSMASIAALLLPRKPSAQRAYVQAMREANPSIAGLGPTDPIPLDANVVLPDLRSLPRVKSEPSIASAPPTSPPPQRPPRAAPKSTEAPKARAPSPSTASEPTTAASPALAATEPAPAPSRPAPVKAPAKAPAPPAAAAAAPRRAPESGERVVLRLSSSEVDLSRSRNINDTDRAKLRERLLVLDNDDQVAALLSLRDSLKRLEGRVAELQLKLSTLPVNPPPATAPAPVAKALPPPKVEAPAPKIDVPPPKVEAAPKVEAPKVEAPKVEAPKIEAPKVEAAPPKVEAPPPKAEAPVVAPAPVTPKPVSKPATAAKPARAADPAEEGVALWIWAALAAAALALVALGWWWLRREPSEEDLPEIQAADSIPPPATEPPTDGHEEREFDVAEPAVAAKRREIDSDATLATEVRGADPAALRQRYMEERFPEIANRAIVLSNPDSVVKAARLFYEDGSIPRAVELLQLAIEEHPQEQRTWLALFEIYRLERMAEPFAEVAQRFRDLHGKGENWRKVQFFGREVDPGNALYRDMSVGIETIKFEAGKPPAPSTYDPIAENWLNAPMDFENELLAVDLRRALMDEAGITDEDLTPNPMPALRSVEMFTVA